MSSVRGLTFWVCGAERYRYRCNHLYTSNLFGMRVFARAENCCLC